MNERISSDSSLDIIARVIDELKTARGSNFTLDDVNLAELERLTGMSRQRLRTLKAHGFKEVPHGNAGTSKKQSILSGFTDTLDSLLSNGIQNSSVCYERLRYLGYRGSQSTVKRYIRDHRYLLPAKRSVVAPQGSRGVRYQTSPGEAFQMDWGFTNVLSPDGSIYEVSCFAMICHHCGMCYIEFFPNAKQESLFIGMLHGFQYLGIPTYVLTDNMKSVVIKRDCEGHPLWQKDYESFMKTVGFRTKLCKPRHPFTKGKVERLVRFVKDNFLQGMSFETITDLNDKALEWCSVQNYKYRDEIEGIPIQLHNTACAKVLTPLEEDPRLLPYLCPERTISFDGFISYEGRRFGVPYRYHERSVRVRRKRDLLLIYTRDLKELLVTHEVTWSRKDQFCEGQYLSSQPEERPTAPVKVLIEQRQMLPDNAFDKFNFGEEDLL